MAAGKKNEPDFTELARFVHEAGQLKKNPRSGWLSIGIRQPESIADHSWRTALIGFALARLEGVDAAKVLALCVFHDLHETRVSDLNTVNARYVSKDAGKASREQCAGVPSGDEVCALDAEMRACETPEARVAKDADLLEMIAQARDYMDSGNKHAEKWIPGAKRKLSTASAKRLARELEKMDSNEFWMRLK